MPATAIAFFSTAESNRDQAKVKKNVKFSKKSTKKTMIVFKFVPICITGKLNSEEKRSMPFKDTMRRRLTLKELQEKKYSFLDSDLPGVLDDLLEKGVIQLPEPKMSEKVGRIADPKYCRYHRM